LLQNGSRKKSTSRTTIYFKTYPTFFFFAIVLDEIAVIQNITLSGYTLQDQVVHLVVLFILAGLLIKKNQNVVVHSVVAFILLIMMLISLIVTSDSLLIQ